MTFDYRKGWRIAEEPALPFDAKAPYIDVGTGRPTPERYTSRDWAAAEWERMWTRVWLLAGPSSDAREPGDWFRFDVGPESFLIARDAQGGLQAQYNVCPHRGSRVALADFGVADSFSCPFHGWRFGLDGTNLEVRDRETFRPEVLCHDINMTKVRVDEVAGLIFISMNPEAPDLRQWLGVVADQLESYDIPAMRVIQHKQSEWAANWKVGVDAFYEVYHLASVHPETQGVMEDYYVQLDQYPNGMSRMYIPFARPSKRFPDQQAVNQGIGMMLSDAGIDPDLFDGSAGEARAAIQFAKRARAARLGLDYSKLSDGQLSDSVPYGLFPNVQLGCHPEGIFMMRFLPHPTDPERFTYDNIILYRPVDDPTYRTPDWMGLPADLDTSGAVRPDIIRTDVGEPPNLGLVLDQDSVLLPVVQAGNRSRGFRGPLWSEQELRVRHFHAELDRYMAPTT